jgi:protein-tyrosine phosphatase
MSAKYRIGIAEDAILMECNSMLSNPANFRGVQNFREIAGYQTVNGQSIKRNKLWRSATLHDLSVEECSALAMMGIKTIADLRGPDERSEKPTPSGLSDHVNILAWTTGGMSAVSDSFRQRLIQAKDRDQIRTMVKSFYCKIAEDHSIQLGDIYRAIANGKTPILIHCAAGKDRTGVAVAILLDLLGVQRERTFEDYELSERLLDWNRMSFSAALGLHDNPETDIAVPADLLEPLMRSDRTYLEAAFQDIEKRYGSTEAFCRERLGLDDAIIEMLQAELLDR